MPQQILPVLPPRTWWTKSEYTPFSPLFENRQAAVSYYGAEPLMMVAEQTDACTVEG